MYDENGKLIPEDPWSSIVDLMSALVLVLFLAIIFFVTNFSEVSAALEVEKQELAARSLDLKTTQEKLINANTVNLDLIAREERLISEKNELESQKLKLIADRDLLIADRDQLRLASEQLRSDKTKLISDKDQLILDKNQLRKATEKLRLDKTKLISDRDQLMADQAKILKEQDGLKAEQTRLLVERKNLKTERKQLLGDKSRLLGDKKALTSQTTLLNAKVLKLQAAIREASTKRANLMDALATSFKKNHAQGVSIDKAGGKIILKSEVLFPQGQSELTAEGKDNLAKVSESLLEVLSSTQLRAQVEGVMVEGHTSSKGEYIKNLDLSADRSINTLQYLLELPKVKQSPRHLRQLFFAGAFGESKPVLKPNGKEDEIKSRRIEIRLLFNQSHVKSLANAISH